MEKIMMDMFAIEKNFKTLDEILIDSERKYPKPTKKNKTILQ